MSRCSLVPSTNHHFFFLPTTDSSRRRAPAIYLPIEIPGGLPPQPFSLHGAPRRVSPTSESDSASQGREAHLFLLHFFLFLPARINTCTDLTFSLPTPSRETARAAFALSESVSWLIHVSWILFGCVCCSQHVSLRSGTQSEGRATVTARATRSRL
ncbi:hypothetical protein VTN02DRAFT_4797 [Thermoascus thermophilus]